MFLTMRVLLDFVVWDNDGLYALITGVAVLFAVVLIIVVMQKSHTPEEKVSSQERVAAARQRLRQLQHIENQTSQPHESTSPTQGA